jgi:hypothetical protein
VVLSNQATDRIVESYGDLGFNLRILKAPRRIRRKERKPALEESSQPKTLRVLEQSRESNNLMSSQVRSR